VINETLDTTTEVLENVIFTSIPAQIIGKSKPSEIIPLLNVICSEWGLKANRVKHFNIAKRILINSIKNN